MSFNDIKKHITLEDQDIFLNTLVCTKNCETKVVLELGPRALIFCSNQKKETKQHKKNNFFLVQNIHC